MLSAPGWTFGFLTLFAWMKFGGPILLLCWLLSFLWAIICWEVALLVPFGLAIRPLCIEAISSLPSFIRATLQRESVELVLRSWERGVEETALLNKKVAESLGEGTRSLYISMIALFEARKTLGSLSLLPNPLQRGVNTCFHGHGLGLCQRT
jgi:hypothetical protein